MSEDAGAGGGQGDQGGGDGFEPITSQDALNKLVGERVARERAKFADYNDLKAKAAELDTLKTAGQTEAEKLNARIAELEAHAQGLERSTLKARIQAKHGISDEDADLFLTGADEETMVKQAQRLAAAVADRKKNGNHVPNEGRTPRTSTPTDERQAVRGLFGGV